MQLGSKLSSGCVFVEAQVARKDFYLLLDGARIKTRLIEIGLSHDPKIENSEK